MIGGDCRSLITAITPQKDTNINVRGRELPDIRERAVIYVLINNKMVTLYMKYA
jgi:hypothetical protein